MSYNTPFCISVRFSKSSNSSFFVWTLVLAIDKSIPNCFNSFLCYFISNDTAIQPIKPIIAVIIIIVVAIPINIKRAK
jgi:hypothetical protein